MSILQTAFNATVTEPLALDTTQKVFTALAGLPTLVVWVGLYVFAPKRNFRTEDPYEKMQWMYAVMSGVMIGQLLGHALPNSTFYSNTRVPFMAAIFGILFVVAFAKLCRVFGYAKYQPLAKTAWEPAELFDDEGRETGNTVIRQENVLLDESYTGMDSEYVTSTEDPRILPASTANLTASDASDIRWIRRRMFEILYITVCAMVIFEGFYLAYNASNAVPELSIPCFYLMKAIQALMLACFAVYAYDHMRARRFLRANYYGWAALVFAVVCVCSTIPAILDLPFETISAIVESGVFGAFYEFFAGVLATVAFFFIAREEYKPTRKGEIIWLALFSVGALSVWALGLVI